MILHCDPEFPESRNDALCVIANPAFVVYSSIVSFYVPFIITLLVYVQIYVVLRKRRKRVSMKRTYPSASADTGKALKVPLFSEHSELCSLFPLTCSLIKGP